MNGLPNKPNSSIYVVGPSSTGKTTLCNALAKTFDLNDRWIQISEVARDVMKRTGFTRDDIGSVEMQKAIQNAQLEKEAAIRAKSLNVLGDRSAIDPVVYAILTASNEGEGEARKKDMMVPLQDVIVDYRQAIFVLLEPVAEFLEDDGIRSMGEHAGCFQLFKHILEELEIKYLQMGAEAMHLEERVQIVLAALEVCS